MASQELIVLALSCGMTAADLAAQSTLDDTQDALQAAARAAVKDLENQMDTMATVAAEQKRAVELERDAALQDHSSEQVMGRQRLRQMGAAVGAKVLLDRLRRQAHAALCCGAGKDPGVVEWLNRTHAAIDHADLADGSLFLEHCDPGALWPHRRYLLLRADAAVKDSSGAEAPGHLLKTLVECARYARRCWGHPAADQDAAALEADARALAEAKGGVVRAYTYPVDT